MPKTQKKNKRNNKTIRELRGQILKWYSKHKRELPWRYIDGQKPDPYPDPYKVWLSEIMLQQTTVQAVKPYYIKFLERWPNVNALAAADRDDILAQWAGLGYYSRARNLYKCAQEIANNWNGEFPDNPPDLKKLPGIGDYTSAAITTIAFNKPATVMDGNIERVMARLFAIQAPLPKSKPQIKEMAAEFFKEEYPNPGDLAQALMDLGATICIPKTPKCSLCPLINGCEGYKQNIAAALPVKSKKKPVPNKKGFVYLVQNEKGEILLHKRPEKGLLAGMMGLPTSKWKEGKVKHLMHLKDFSNFKNKNTKINHVFTHFNLTLHLKTAQVKAEPIINGGEYLWKSQKEIDISSFPSLFQKALHLFFE